VRWSDVPGPGDDRVFAGRIAGGGEPATRRRSYDASGVENAVGPSRFPWRQWGFHFVDKVPGLRRDLGSVGISRSRLLSARLRSARAAGSSRSRLMTTVYVAPLRWRSPERLIRWRTILPDEADIRGGPRRHG